jgi:H+/Cl- antiporter ClcA
VPDLEHSRRLSLVALLATSVGTGAVAGLVTASFIWLLDSGMQLLWDDLPGWVGVEPFDSWWLFAVPVAGGALVGVGHRVIGNYPEPIEEVIAIWRSGRQLEPAVAPKSAAPALVALVMGGPLGFEAALTGLIGGTAGWIGRRVHAVEQFVRRSWGPERVASMPRLVASFPYWLAAIAGFVTYRLLPFGHVDLGFRFSDFDGSVDATDAVAILAFAALVTVPASWAIAAVTRAEFATFHRRSPVLIGMAGAVLFALLAVGNDVVLFSGQQGIQLLPDPGTSTAGLLYLSVAKWLALVIALYAGWRGGPIFPMYTSVAAFGVVAADVIDVSPDLIMIGGIAAVSVVFVRGRLPLAFLLSLYPVPLSYALVIAIGCVGGRAALLVARPLKALPRPVEDHPG